MARAPTRTIFLLCGSKRNPVALSTRRVVATTIAPVTPKNRVHLMRGDINTIVAQNDESCVFAILGVGLVSYDRSMAAFRILGGKKLYGTVSVFGAKNAALKAMAAALLTQDPVYIENVPNIVDVSRMADILESMGTRIEWDKTKRIMAIVAKDIYPERIDATLVGMLRASVVLLGPLLARFGEVKLPWPGGDNIGVRPLTTHLAAFEKMGAEIISESPVLDLRVPSGGLKAGRVVLREFSVTATENILMAAALVAGTSSIEIAAAEPHVENLSRMLVSMGAKVQGGGTHTITVSGTKNLKGVRHWLIPDMLDAATFIMAGLATKGDVTVEGFDPGHVTLALEKLREMGAKVTEGKNSVHAVLGIGGLKGILVQAMPYPGIPTDVGPLFAVLATQATGTSLIHDPLFENRFRYLPELERMGAKARLLDAHRAEITGPTALQGIPIISFDIRAGAALVIAGLAASGETRIEGIEHIERGYENLEGRLSALGADITRLA